MQELLLESGLLLVVGISAVFTSLLMLAGMIWLFKAADEALNAKRVRKYAVKVENKGIDPDHNDEIVAVISAAVIAAIQRPVQVRHIRFLGEQGEDQWASAGRSTIMSSHTFKTH